METLFRWSKHVDEDRLDEWETRLIVAEVTYTAEKIVKRKRWQLSSYTTTRDQADELRATFGGGVTEVRPRDWQPSAEVGAGTVLKIRDKLVVIEGEDDAVWESQKKKYPNRDVLSFPPQLAFGTGGHPTTAGCLRFLTDFAGSRTAPDWSVLDLGCGSGILAIAAAKLGAKKIVAVEIDEMALQYARINAERHGVADQIEFLEGNVIEMLREQALGRFDLVAANLFSNLLLELMPLFGDSLEESGELILSGFLTSQAKEIIESSARNGVPLRDFLRRGKWVAGHGAKAGA